MVEQRLAHTGLSITVFTPDSRDFINERIREGTYSLALSSSLTIPAAYYTLLALEDTMRWPLILLSLLWWQQHLGLTGISSC
jgi:hypothetical protein